MDMVLTATTGKPQVIGMVETMEELPWKGYDSVRQGPRLTSPGQRMCDGRCMDLKHANFAPQLMLRSRNKSGVHLLAKGIWHVCYTNVKVVVAYWKVKTPCHAHGECIN